MDGKEQQTDIEIDIDTAAKKRMANFRFRFGSGSINPNDSVDSDSSSVNVMDISPNTTPTGTPTQMSKTHGRSSSHHSRSNSVSTTFTFPFKPSTMNNLPPPTALTQSNPVNDSPVQQLTSGFIPSGPTPRSRPNSHHKRRSSVSTRRESAELMGISPPESLPVESDTIMDGRRMALWALEGKGKATRRPDFISGYTQVEIPDLNFSNGDENEPPAKSQGFSSFNHNSFPPVATINKCDILLNSGPTVPISNAFPGKRDTYPSFGLGSTNSASKRDSFSIGFGLGMGMCMTSVSKRDSFGKFLNAGPLGDPLGTLLEEEEEEGLEEEEEEAAEEEGEEQADETLHVETMEDRDEILLEMNLDEEFLPHLMSGSPTASVSALVPTPSPVFLPGPAPISTSVTTSIQPPICNSASITDISVAKVTSSLPTVPIVDSLSPFINSPSSTISTSAPTSTLSSMSSPTPATNNTPRPRPANLNLNFALRPLSLTPDSLPLNTRAASISPSLSILNDPSTSTSMSGTAGSAGAYTPSPRIPGLRPLSLVAAVSSSSSPSLAPGLGSSQPQSSMARRMSLLASSNMSGPSPGSNSSVSYRRSSLSSESDSSGPTPTNEPSRPIYQFATTLRRTSQSHLPTPGATPTSAVSPLHSGLPFGMSMMQEEEECADADETAIGEFQLGAERDAQTQGSDGDASTPTGPSSTVGIGATKQDHQSLLHAHDPHTLDRPLSPTEQTFLYRSHTSLLSRISELEEIIAKNHHQQRGGGRTSRGLSPSGCSDISTGRSSSYGSGRRRHGRFESSVSSVSTNTSMDSAASPPTSALSSSEPSDELLQLITDLKTERDSLMHDVQTYQERVTELEKTIATLTRRVEAERRESWVAQERMSVLEIERRRAAEEVSRLKDVIKDLQRHQAEDELKEFERVKAQLKVEKERISKLEVQVEDVRRELDAEKVKVRLAEDEAGLLRMKMEEMSREMDALRVLITEQQAEIFRFQQQQRQAQTKRIIPAKKMFNSSLNSFVSSGSGSSSASTFSNSLSHVSLSSTSTLAVDAEADGEDGEGDQFKYVPFGMSLPPHRSHSDLARATLGSVAEAEEEVGDVPRDIMADEAETEVETADVNAEEEEEENELAHYEDVGEFDEDVQFDEGEDEDVVWGEDSTTSSFGEFVPRRGGLLSVTPTPMPSPENVSAPSGFRRGHARVGSMEKGWSFASAQVKACQAPSRLNFTSKEYPNSEIEAADTERSKKITNLPKVDRFFDCLDDLDLDDDAEVEVDVGKAEFTDSKSFWSGMMRSSSTMGGDQDEMDLPPFLLPPSSDSPSASLDVIVEEDEDEDQEEQQEEGLSTPHLTTPTLTPSWKDLIAAKLEVVAEEGEEDLYEDDDCPPSPSFRPSLLPRDSSSSFIPRPSVIYSSSSLFADRASAAPTTSLVPPASVLSQMTPNTLKTTLDATVRSPPPSSNRWSIGSSLGTGLPHNDSNTAATATPVKTRYSFSPSTPISNSGANNNHYSNDNSNVSLPTPPPTLIPRLVSKSGLSSPSPASPISPSPVLSVPTRPTSPSLSSSSSPVSSDFADRERALLTPTPSFSLTSKYGPLSPSRIPTPSKKKGGTDSFANLSDDGTIPYDDASLSVSHQGETSGSGIDGHGSMSNTNLNTSVRDDDDGGGSGDSRGDGTLAPRHALLRRDGEHSRSKSRLGFFGNTRSSAGIGFPPDHDLQKLGLITSSSGTTTTLCSTSTGTRVNSTGMFGGFATRLIRFLEGESATAANSYQTLSASRRSRFRFQVRPRVPVYVNREKQVEALRARMRMRMQMQMRGEESQGRGRMKDEHEDVRMVGCSHCAGSNIIDL